MNFIQKIIVQSLFIISITSTMHGIHKNDLDDSDDIVPVPHELINSVKKANKQKKKLEKLEKNKRKKFLKKQKRKNNE